MGKAVGNEELEREGNADELEGAAKAVVEDVNDAAEEAKRAIENALK